MHIRRLKSHEATLHRELRLRALQDSPDSFGDTFADVTAQSARYWEELTHSVAEPGQYVMFLACEGEDVFGSTYGIPDRDQSDIGRVGGMWVDPTWRRKGVGRALLRQVFDWAQDNGFVRLQLWAPAHSPAALALYRRAGFRETGNKRPLPTNSSLQIVEMEARV